MKASTRARRRAAVLISIVGLAMWVTFGSPFPAGAAALVRFVNGREIVVREYWTAGVQVWFTQPRGTVGVPREFVAAIEAIAPPRKIGGGPEAVNGAPLVAPDPIR